MNEVTWSAWGPVKLITAKLIQQFADVTDNHQWVHEDTERCLNESPYGRQIAHGLLLVSLIPSLLPDDGELPKHTVRIIRGIDTLRLPWPAYPGDSVRVRVQLQNTYTAPSGKGTIIERKLQLWTLSGKKPSVTCVLKLQYF